MQRIDFELIHDSIVLDTDRRQPFRDEVIKEMLQDVLDYLFESDTVNNYWYVFLCGIYAGRYGVE